MGSVWGWHGTGADTDSRVIETVNAGDAVERTPTCVGARPDDLRAPTSGVPEFPAALLVADDLDGFVGFFEIRDVAVRQREFYGLNGLF